MSSLHAYHILVFWNLFVCTINRELLTRKIKYIFCLISTWKPLESCTVKNLGKRWGIHPTKFIVKIYFTIFYICHTLDIVAAVVVDENPLKLFLTHQYCLLLPPGRLLLWVTVSAFHLEGKGELSHFCLKSKPCMQQAWDGWRYDCLSVVNSGQNSTWWCCTHITQQGSTPSSVSLW